MSTSYHEKIRELLDQTAALPVDQQRPFLEQMCAGRAQMVDDILSLLPHYENAADLALRPIDAADWELPATTTAADVGLDTLSADVEPLVEFERPLPFLVGPYELTEVLGRGGMGLVYRARHARRSLPVAIKFLRRALTRGQDLERFALEIEILRRLQHDGIARLLYADMLGADDDPRPYFVMELIEGRPLTRFAADEALDVRARLELLIRVCDAVEYAHHRGIIHRDLKPDNVLVLADGRPKVLDFGIARIETWQADIVRERHGTFAGTPRYASPEQLAGRIDALTPRSDVYTLGLIAAELLTGHPWTRTGTPQPSLDQVSFEPQSPLDAYENRTPRSELTVILGRALAMAEADRHPTAGALAADLLRVLDLARPRTTWEIWRERIRAWLAPRDAGDATTGRPLSAVLRTRIANAVESELSGADKPRGER